MKTISGILTGALWVIAFQFSLNNTGMPIVFMTIIVIIVGILGTVYEYEQKEKL